MIHFLDAPNKDDIEKAYKYFEDKTKDANKKTFMLTMIEVIKHETLDEKWIERQKLAAFVMIRFCIQNISENEWNGFASDEKKEIKDTVNE